MTRLLFLLVATLAATYAELDDIEYEPNLTPVDDVDEDLLPNFKEEPSTKKDPLTIDPNVHPKDTLSYYLNNLTNYIYETDIHAGADPRAEFFNQEHQLRIYETLNHFVEKNYGSSLKYILDDKHFNPVVPLKIKQEYVGKILDLEEKVDEMFLKVIYGSGDKPVDKERLEQVQKQMGKLVFTFATHATWIQVVQAYLRLWEIHQPVLDNFNNTAYFAEESRVKRGAAPFNDTKLQEELTASLKKITSFVLGTSEAEFLSPKISVYIQPLGSLISFQRFLDANYRKYLSQEYVDNEKEAKEHEIKEIKQIEEKTTALWFEVVNYANLDLLKNQTIIDDINAAIAERLDVYKHFRTLDDIKEVNRRIHEVYGHLLKNCDQSSYLNLVKYTDKYHIKEFPTFSEPEGIFERLSMIERIVAHSETKWQPVHGASGHEKRRVREHLGTISDIGLHFLDKTLKPDCVFSDITLERHVFNETEGFKGHLFNETNSELKRVNVTSQLEPTFG